ncbi:MAG TPA: 3-hydroxylacyl-ACP dehydratase [Janthinobacterium sp.]|nr:3-hydroxylacyl-ACP dehydratase [Janthinobacterium sp.]
MSYPDIRTLVPHSGAMVLLDRVLQADADALCAEVTIRADSLFFDGAGVGAWIGIEYMAQAVAAHGGYLARGAAPKIGFLLGTRRFESRRPRFALGSVLRVHARRVAQGDNGMAMFACDIEEGGASVATATISVFQPAGVFFEENEHGNGQE